MPVSAEGKPTNMEASKAALLKKYFGTEFHLLICILKYRFIQISMTVFAEQKTNSLAISVGQVGFHAIFSIMCVKLHSDMRFDPQCC